MNIEEIKKKVDSFKDDWERSRQCYDMEDFSDDVLHLLSIIEQYEYRMKITTVELQDWVRSHEGTVIDKEYVARTKEIIASNYEFHLQAIRGN